MRGRASDATRALCKWLNSPCSPPTKVVGSTDAIELLPRRSCAPTWKHLLREPPDNRILHLLLLHLIHKAASSTVLGTKSSWSRFGCNTTPGGACVGQLCTKAESLFLWAVPLAFTMAFFIASTSTPSVPSNASRAFSNFTTFYTSFCHFREKTLFRLFDAGVHGRMWNLSCYFLRGTQSQVRLGSSLSAPCQTQALPKVGFSLRCSSTSWVAPVLQLFSSSARSPGQFWCR